MTYGPVSYTHLDVYKRQLKHKYLFKCVCLIVRYCYVETKFFREIVFIFKSRYSAARLWRSAIIFESVRNSIVTAAAGSYVTGNDLDTFSSQRPYLEARLVGFTCATENWCVSIILITSFNWLVLGERINGKREVIVFVSLFPFELLPSCFFFHEL